MTLGDKQFQIGGITFGLDAPIALVDGGWNMGTPETTTQDVSNPRGDGVRFGRDRHGSLTWSWSLFTNMETEEDAWAVASQLERVWKDRNTRLSLDTVVPLTYRLAGVTRVVYGRPRRFTPTVDNRSLGGRIDITCDFSLAYPAFFGETEHSQTITVNPPIDLEAGLEVPFVPPFNTSPGATERTYGITIGGEAPTPVRVEIHGLIEDPYVSVGPAVVSLRETVTADNPVTADPRPWVNSITTANGGGVEVAPRETRLSNLWLPPGDHAVVLRGFSATGTATAVLRWQDAYETPR
jgi:hypothetical protein